MFQKLFVVLVAVLVLAVAVPVMAQDKAKGRGKQAGAKARPQVQILPQQLLEGLELTDEQKAKLAEIEKQMKAPMVEARKAVDGLLTDEQKEARKAAMAKAKEEGKKPQEAQKAVDEALKLTPEQRREVGHELSDVLMGVIRVADLLEIDLAAAFAEKMELNRQKYPPEKVQGRAVKYTKL